MIEWKDTTSYKRGQERIPTTWTARGKNITVTVTSTHIANPGKWTMHCRELWMDTVDVGLPSDALAEVAQKKAIKMVQRRLKEMIRELWEE